MKLRDVASYEAQFEYAMREGKYLEAASLIDPNDPFRDSKRLRVSVHRPWPDPALDPDPRYVHWGSNGGAVTDPDYATASAAYAFGRRSMWGALLLALGVGAALGFVAGWVAR